MTQLPDHMIAERRCQNAAEEKKSMHIGQRGEDEGRQKRTKGGGKRRRKKEREREISLGQQRGAAEGLGQAEQTCAGRLQVMKKKKKGEKKIILHPQDDRTSNPTNQQKVWECCRSLKGLVKKNMCRT